MDNRQRVFQLVDNIPEQKLPFLITLLESIQAYAGEEIEPDELDMKMIAEAEKDNDGAGMTIEDFAKELNIEL